MKSWITGSVLTALFLLVTFLGGFVTQRMDWLHVTVVAFTYYGVILLAIAVFAKPPKPVKNDCYRPFVSALVPARNEENVIEATVRSLAAMSYRKNGKPNFEVLVIDDCSIDNTWSILERLQDEIPHVRAIRRDPKDAGTGKSAVLNEGLRTCRGDVVAVFDADTMVEPNFLKKTVPYLYPDDVGGVQGRVRIYNAGYNLLTKLQEDEFSVLAHLTQIGKECIGGVTALGGNGQLTKRSVLEQLNGWNVLSTTEDLDLSLRMLVVNSSIRYCPDAVIWQEGVATSHALIRQRVRWAEGFMKCLFDYGFQILFAPCSWIKRLDGFVSLTRIMIPLWLWVWYMVLTIYTLCGNHYGTDLSNVFYLAASWSFFLVMTAGMKQQAECSWTVATLRVVRYWLYNFIWVVVVPLAFHNCLKNFNQIIWDKTEHSVDHRAAMPVVPQPELVLTGTGARNSR